MNTKNIKANAPIESISEIFIKSGDTFQQKIEQECIIGSAIHPKLYQAAVTFIEDTGFWEPNTLLNHSINRFWLTKQPHNFGKLACFQQETGDLWQAKAANPRLDYSKTQKRLSYKLQRSIDSSEILNLSAQHSDCIIYTKYEAPKGIGAKPYLPPVTAGIWLAIARRINLLNQVPQIVIEQSHLNENVVVPGFWDWVAANPAVPIIYTEGAKKALSLLSKGYAAISLFGIHGGYRSHDSLGHRITPHLIPELDRFCSIERSVLLAFDQDSKAKTRKQVTAALFRFGGLLAASGCTVKLILWNGQLGKGVDDLIARAGLEVFQRAIDLAYTLDEYRLLLALQNRLQGINPTIRLQTANLNEIEAETIPKSGILAISSAKGTGKTKLIQTLTADEGNALLAGHRIALTRNLCSRLKLHYRGDLDRAQGHFINDSGYVLRVGTCVDSLLAINPDDFAGCDLILDEAVQVLRHLLTSSTCNKDGKRPALLARFTELVRTARRVVLADADLSTETIRYIQSLRNDSSIPWLLVNEAQVTPWQIDFIEASNATAITARLLKDIQAGQKTFVATDSKAGSQKLERLIAQIETIGYRCLLLNSETSGGELERAFIETPDHHIENYDVVIATPSMATGISIEKSYFDVVYGFFWGVSSTDADMAQALARVRPAVPRVVWCAKTGRNFSSIGRDVSSLKLKKLLQDKTNITAQLTATSLGSAHLQQFETYDWLNPHVHLWSIFESAQNRSMLSLRSALKVRLIHEGHQVRITSMDTYQEVRAALRAARDEVRRMEASAISDAANLTLAEAEALEQLETLQPDERLALKKWYLADFYCLPLSQITPELVLADDKGHQRSQITNLEQFLDIETAVHDDVQQIKKQTKWEHGISPWDVPHSRLKRKIRRLLGLQDFIIPGKVWTAESLANFTVKALHFASEIKAVLNVTVSEHMSPNQILGQLLEQIGLKTESKQFRQHGKRKRCYWLNQNHHAYLLEIIERRAKRGKTQLPLAPTDTPLSDISVEKTGCDSSSSFGYIDPLSEGTPDEVPSNLRSVDRCLVVNNIKRGSSSVSMQIGTPCFVPDSKVVGVRCSLSEQEAAF